MPLSAPASSLLPLHAVIGLASVSPRSCHHQPSSDASRRNFENRFAWPLRDTSGNGLSRFVRPQIYLC
ncbi:hypothetical protein AAHA92_17394 [Salvia divinorum]|uniref:Secreted protein n=1 Tax=Salvia divinorum TaxID=28513 RepID=A0ABD1GYM4_SALDI